MKLFLANQIREIDKYTIDNEPVASVDLMERAARALASWFTKRFNIDTGLVFFAGPGNNGGDAWALARLLHHEGYKNIRFYLIGTTDKISPDSRINHQRLIDETDVTVNLISKEKDFPYISDKEWVVDALFGSGLSRPLDGLAKTLVQYINSSPKAGTISIDIPSGLFCDNNLDNTKDSIINADNTLCFQFPKLSFLYAENEPYVGNWEVLPIGLHEDIIRDLDSPYNYISPGDINDSLKTPSKFSHKGTNGHCLIIAGCYGMMGAAVLATKAAVKAGSGLVTAHVPRLGYQIMQSSVPEALISFDESDLIFTEVNNLEKYNAIAVGPGLNTKTNTVKAVREIIRHAKIPIVIDADGINILSQNQEWMTILPEKTILTPHPGEFDRLTQKHSTSYSRTQAQINISKKHNIIIVLKGAYTSISFGDGSIWFNSTGNPGMAKGGSGDVLTGIICSLLAQGYTPEQAGMIGVYVHGLAGDIGSEGEGYHGLTPSDIIANIGKAFKKIETHE